MERIFYDNVQHYGFFDEKPLKNLTDRIDKKKIVKVPYTGNYLFRDLALSTFKRIRKEAGDEVILTSGVRGIMKQFLLFLNKAYQSNGNLSLASRSIAPPGYSYHGIGDFDVGQVGFGAENFTERFTDTRVYRRLSTLGYLKLRYSQNNLLGVRYEPWHIKL
jgi:LAS superfamily LD-carboxypeptidase LdcB